jgi:hypothetical protein
LLAVSKIIVALRDEVQIKGRAYIDVHAAHVNARISAHDADIVCRIVENVTFLVLEAEDEVDPAPQQLTLFFSLKPGIAVVRLCPNQCSH